MNGKDEKFREALIGQDKTSVSQNYKKEIGMLLDNKLSKWSRLAYLCVSIVCLLVTINLFNVLNFSHAIPKVFAAIGLVPTIFLVVYAGWSAISGKVRGRLYSGFVFGGIIMLLGFYLVTLFYVTYILPVAVESPNDWRSILGIQLMILGFSAVIGVGITVLLFVLGQMKYHTHKKLLEIEYKMCELMEKQNT